MASPRFNHAATLLPGGRVLIAGGSGANGPLASAEVYDPASGTWSTTGSMASPRFSLTATPLPGGKVFITRNGPAEIYDPVTGTFSAAVFPSMAGNLTVTPVNGRLLVVGLFSGGNGPPDGLAEMYNPSSGTMSPAGRLTGYRYYHQTTLLPNGRVLISGGIGPTAMTAELYTP